MDGSDKLCGMILSSLTSERGQPTGLSLACSSSAIAEALRQLVAVDSTFTDTYLNSGYARIHVYCCCIINLCDIILRAYYMPCTQLML